MEDLISDNPAFDYGSERSLREFAATTTYRRLFQKLDKEMYMKIITERLLRSIVTFLDQMNVDTSSLQQREKIILNNGIMISSSTISGQVAIGDQPSITSTHF
jgi:hypothetical protein